MKKLILLFTIICAGQLYGMEPILPTKEKSTNQKEALAIYTSPEMLPELRKEIINNALAISDNVKEAIGMIKKFSILHGVKFDTLFNLKDFTKLVHLLADRFKDDDMVEIANIFKTPIAKNYLTLAAKFMKAIKENNRDTITQCIQEGADVNGTTYDRTGNNVSPLYIAVYVTGNTEVIQLLLDHGAHRNKKTLFDLLRRLNNVYNGEEGTIKQMLEEAIKK